MSANYGALHKHREALTERDEMVTRQTKLTNLHKQMIKDVENIAVSKGKTTTQTERAPSKRSRNSRHRLKQLNKIQFNSP